MNWMERIREAAQKDFWYQQALQKVRDLEPSYLEILWTLPEEKQKVLEDYIAACEAIDDALLRLAQEMGNSYEEMEK